MIKLAIFCVCAALDALWVLIGWHKDCKKIGKENLAMSLSERFQTHLIFVDGPIAIGLLMRK